MRSVYYEIVKFPSIAKVRECSDKTRGQKTPLTIEVTLVPHSGGAEFIVDVDIEMMSECAHRVYVSRGQPMPDGSTSRGGRNAWKWETTVDVYGTTKFSGFGKAKTTVDLRYHMLAQSGKLEAKIADSEAA